jgi:hypothetical protein
MRLMNPSDLHWIEEMADQGYGDFADYYPESAEGTLEPEEPYYGRNVIWDGYDGRMIRVDPDYMVAIPGNIFDPDKLAAIVEGIRNASDRVVFTAPYGLVGVVEPGDVKESIEADEHGDAALDRPLTTGDEDLDLWLVNPDQYMEDLIGRGELHDSEAEYLAEATKLEAEMEEALADAVANREGDLGKLTFQIRDGNHRAFGAILAGEPDLWMIVMGDQMQDIKRGDYPEVAERLE